MVVLLVVFAACAVIAWFVAPANANQSFKDSAAVLAFISLAAVAIERSIEGFFTLMAGRFGEWWPLKAVKLEFDTFEAKTNETLGPVVRQTIDELTAAKALAGQSRDEVTRIQGLIDQVDAEQRRLSGRLRGRHHQARAGLGAAGPGRRDQHRDDHVPARDPHPEPDLHGWRPGAPRHDR